MFILNREEFLGKMELTLATVIDIMENRAGSSCLGIETNIVNVWTEGNEANFMAIIYGNKLKIIRINGEKVDISILRNKNNGMIIDKNLNFSYKYNVEKLEDDIRRITVMQEQEDGNTFCQSYLQKEDDALLIFHGEQIAKKNLPKNTKYDTDFSVTIVNKNLYQVSEEQTLEYAKKEMLGLQRNNGEPYKEKYEYEDEVDIWDFSEDDEESYKEICDQMEEEPCEKFGGYSEVDENFEEYEYNLDDDMTEEEREQNILEDYESIYNGFVVYENNRTAEGIGAYEMIDDVYEELINSNIYIDQASIDIIECAFDEIQGISMDIEVQENIHEDKSKIKNQENQNDLNEEPEER